MFALLLIIPIVWIALSLAKKPVLPGLSVDSYKKLDNPVQPKQFSNQDTKKYLGFGKYLRPGHREKQVMPPGPKAPGIRAAFYVNWDPQATYSLENNISKLDMVIPEWFFIDPRADTLVLARDFDPGVYKIMKRQPGLKIVPILNNININDSGTLGGFDGKLLSAVLLDSARRNRLINDIDRKLTTMGLQGINIDFEEIEEKSVKAMQVFQKDLVTRLHKTGKLVTQDIAANDNAYDPAELAKYNDYLFLMAYDQHFLISVPGPVSDQRWIEKQLALCAAKVSPEKIILCLAGYGYDWVDGHEGNTISYQEAMSTAREFNARINFNPDSYNCGFEYKDFRNRHHTISFLDAAGTFDIMRFADEYGTAGVALWRLGSEDERIWKFYRRDLTNKAVAAHPFDFSSLASIDVSNEKPEYLPGDGEVLDLMNEPQEGVFHIHKDSAHQSITAENYQQLPTRYVIKRFGQVKNQVILTFDDGPDPDYTPRILDILEKEHVPASFFVVGINAQSHLPILKDIYRKGYEIGNHSFTHPNMADVSDRQAVAETEATRLVIEMATGRSTILFRPPYNADAEPTKAVELKPVARGKNNHYYAIGESIDPEDWDTDNGVNADSIYNRVVRQYEKRPSKGIILFHDAGGNREATVRALPRVIAYFKKKGVQFTDVSTLLGLTKDDVMPPVHNQLVKMNSWVTVVLYWLQLLLTGAFWTAIVLGLGRILFLAGVAIMQYYRSKKEAPLLAAAAAIGKVSIIIPAYNEEVNIISTIKNLLNQDYPDFEIIFVDDGSTDGTYPIVKNEFSGNTLVKILTKPNSGKASALNYGISQASGKYLVCIDADTQLAPDAVRQLMYYMADEKTGAVAGNVKVGNDRKVITKWQSIEYITAQNFDRRAFDYMNCITVVPGAIGAFRKDAVEKAGGFTTDTLAEDCDLTIRILRNGYKIRNADKAIAVTEAPETIRQFMKQRFRWCYGIMQSFWKHRKTCFNPRYEGLGMVAMPNILLFQIVIPVIAPIADLIFFFSLAWNWHDLKSAQGILFFYGLFLFVDVAVAMLAFSFEKEKWTRLWWLLPQRFIYRQLMYVILFRAIARAVKGEVQSWGALKRTGNAQGVIGNDDKAANIFVTPAFVHQPAQREADYKKGEKVI